MAFAVSGQQAAFTAQVNLISCWFVIDNSGSMAGNKWNMAVSGVVNCINQLTPSDHVGILTFASDVKVVYAGPRENGTKPIQEIRKRSADGGGTNLYDAMIQAGMLSLALHVELKKAAASRGVSNILTYMVLLTDGEDTGSKATIANVKDVLQRANQIRGFKIVLTGIGLSAGPAKIMRDFGAIGDNDIEFRELKSNKDIENLFEHVALEITRTLRTLVVTENGAAVVEQRQVLNLASGQVSSTTRGMIATGSQTANPLNRPLVAAIDNGPAAMQQAKPSPRKPSDYWDPHRYDLTAKEMLALVGCVFVE